MQPTIIIRNERPEDYRTVERLTREAFWNVYVPGCTEHYLVHKMRSHPDFVPELAFVLELEGNIIGNIMYTQSKLTDETGFEKTILTFGPVSIHPNFQRQGYGKQLIAYSLSQAKTMGYDTVVILGDPNNYVGLGFVSCQRHNIVIGDGIFPYALLVKPLTPDALDGRRWVFHESSVGQVCSDNAMVAAFDAQFPPKETAWMPSQEAFYIQSHATVTLD